MATESSVLPLRTLARELGGRDGVACHRRDGALSWAELAALSTAWEARIPPLPGRFVQVRLEQGHDLLACLLAIWRLGRIAVLGGQSPAATDQATTAESVTDAHVHAAVLPGTQLAVSDQAALILFTSGSSGAPAAIAKTFNQLDAELTLLEACWGQRVATSVFASTVPRQHMYGLPFSLLWPAARGSAFIADTVHYSQSLEGLCRRFPLTLVSSPVQLDHLPDNLDWQVLRAGLRAIFSAGAPLPQRAAQLCRDRLVPATEIYGSTETGAVAWRDQTEDSHWQCLPGVAVAASASGLRIHSPCLDDASVDVADRAEVFSPHRFALLGRADRIAKVGGKRISLTAVENHLLSHPWVEAARATQLDDRKGRIGAVVVLSGEGRAALIDRGRHTINQRLANHVSPDLEPVAIPRYWRYVGRLPLTPQGKVTEELLHSLFHPERQPRQPELLEQRLTDCTANLMLRVPDNLFYFSGHFPGNPVLPGVVQINWAERFGRQLFSGLDRFQRLETLKFQHIIQPGDVVNLALSWEADKHRLLFSYSAAKAQHSSGRLVYGGHSE